ncbi:Nif3-like dinuclear metal center hexameric protein [Lactobacillus sp. ESL0791]|uniref:Nif3-like dinuclear metal center hexameric protein n=1 Tax=Lactobacillus sp. ESL0791 TaxID=2983234 RepID=UPI0023F752AB|nr:Nif3-like dinuclear metal center hexameric protein [Lactobacillus sp. ESL0791]MDF7638042.1 Nif3-like dinuclear metal center hexameric protein [Lactobacillus sp. ESL0791]
MKVSEVIKKIKEYHTENNINKNTTRDKVLFNHVEEECTGIVITTWASIDVIKKAIKLGANLIVSHEALFWNHGDHTDWLQYKDNATYLLKKKLLNEHKITVWRDHDHVHYAGIPVNGKMVDGIFYGVAKLLGWDKYVVEGKDSSPRYGLTRYRQFTIPETTAFDISQKLIKVGNLNGTKIYGNPKTKVKNIIIPGHNLGDAKDIITKVDKENIDLVLEMETIDFTLSEYIRDSSMLGLNKALVTIGHFNLEEFGMKYMVEYLPEIFDNKINCTFVQSGDMYHYDVAKF